MSKIFSVLALKLVYKFGSTAGNNKKKNKKITTVNGISHKGNIIVVSLGCELSESHIKK